MIRDEDLVLRYARWGDEGAFETLVRRQYPRSYRLAYRALGDAAAADDCVQEAFIALLRACRRFREDAPFAPYWNGILTRCLRRERRRRGRRARHEQGFAARRPRQVASAAEGRADREELRDQLAELSPVLGSALLLHYFEGLTHTEVAAALGCSAGTASSRIRRGKEALRARLAGSGYAGLAVGLEVELNALAAVEAPASAAPQAAALLALAARTTARALIAKAALAGLAIALTIGGLERLRPERSDRQARETRFASRSPRASRPAGTAGAPSGVSAAPASAKPARSSASAPPERSSQGEATSAAMDRSLRLRWRGTGPFPRGLRIQIQGRWPGGDTRVLPREGGFLTVAEADAPIELAPLFAGEPPASLAIGFEADDAQDGFVETLLRGDPGPVITVDFALERAAALAGRVIARPEQLEGLEAVRAILVADGRPDDWRVLAEASPAEDGSYRLKLDRPGPVLVVALSREAPPASARAEAVVGEERPVPDIELGGGVELGGLVTLPDGRPASECSIVLEPIPEPADVELSDGLLWRSGQLLSKRRARADLKGRYHATGLAPGRYVLALEALDVSAEVWLEAAAREANRLEVTAPSASADLPLSYGLTQVDVFSAAGRLADARVTVKGPYEPERTESGIALGLKPGQPYEFVVTREGFRPQRRPVTVRAGFSGAVRFDLEPEGPQIELRLRGVEDYFYVIVEAGRVLDGEFKAASGSWIRRRGETYEIGGLEPGRWTLQIEGERRDTGARISEKRGAVVVAGSVTRVELAPRPVGRLRVFIQDEAGSEARAEVRVYDASGREVSRSRAAANRFRMLSGSLTPGLYQVQARAGERSSARRDVEIRAGEVAELALALGG